VRTNIVIFAVDAPGRGAAAVVARWKEAGVLALAIDDLHVRVVTHYDVGRAGIDRAVATLARIMTTGRRRRRA
jgi:threonine aldolase